MKKIFLLGTCLVMAAQVFAWGQKGHRIVAQVAYTYMRPKTVKQVDKMLGHNGLVYWSTWPDEIKSDPVLSEWGNDWHYQDMDAHLPDSFIVAARTDYPSHGGNLFRVTDSLTTVLQSNPKDTLALILMAHLIGDIYCPVHMAHEEDKGGNRIKMQWFGNKTNLHTVWDTQLIESQGYSYTEYGAFLVDNYRDRKQLACDMDAAQIVLQTYHWADSIYTYQEQWDGSAYHYIYHWHEVAEDLLYQAGVRLAQFLNTIYP